jgi:hypothetical protein
MSGMEKLKQILRYAGDDYVVTNAKYKISCKATLVQSLCQKVTCVVLVCTLRGSNDIASTESKKLHRVLHSLHRPQTFNHRPWGEAQNNMASHQFAIAKASFSAGLLRPDPTSLTREEIEHFHSLLDSAVVQCTRANVQV